LPSTTLYVTVDLSIMCGSVLWQLDIDENFLRVRQDRIGGSVRSALASPFPVRTATFDDILAST
ncbi:hypothetical protein IW262DRAFT_1258233, partial [Armillaria fumosa]